MSAGSPAGPTTIGSVLRRSTDYLIARGSETPRLDAERLLAKALGLQRIDLYMALDRPLTPSELEVARELVVRRGTREPLQYVLGEWGFRRLILNVDPRALIPRPETEILVERALLLLDGRDAPSVLDVGTGSGAIALALRDEHFGARVTGFDFSPDALALASENAALTGLTIELLQGDLFDGLPAGPWDLVVSSVPRRSSPVTPRTSSARTAPASSSGDTTTTRTRPTSTRAMSRISSRRSGTGSRTRR